MTRTEMQDLREKLDDFGRVLDAKKCRLEREGVMTQSRAEQWGHIEINHAHLYSRIHGMPDNPGIWATLRHELVRDFEAVCEDFRRLMDRLDVEENLRGKAAAGQARAQRGT